MRFIRADGGRQKAVRVPSPRTVCRGSTRAMTQSPTQETPPRALVHAESMAEVDCPYMCNAWRLEHPDFPVRGYRSAVTGEPVDESVEQRGF